MGRVIYQEWLVGASLLSRFDPNRVIPTGVKNLGWRSFGLRPQEGSGGRKLRTHKLHAEFFDLVANVGSLFEGKVLGLGEHLLLESVDSLLEFRLVE